MDLAYHYSRQRNIKENKMKFLTFYKTEFLTILFWFIFTSYVTLFAAITKSYLLFKFQ